MKKQWLAVACICLCVSACADSDAEPTPTTLPPVLRLRGEACEARNDCADELACVAGVCSRSDFDILPTAKHCDRVQCSEDADCCGDLPLEAEARCKNRDMICETTTLPQCSSWTSCSSNEACGGGRCIGACTATSERCSQGRPCAQDECINGTCLLGGACTTSAECTRPNWCDRLQCSCSNPLFNISDPICAEPDCEPTCDLRCRNEQCVVLPECDADLDCLRHGRLNHCVDGGCVDCAKDNDCLASGEVCRSGVCEVACMANEQCPLFHACTDGECVESGCQSDRECVLALGGADDGVDARLAQCLPVTEGAALKTCRVPCDNDAECSNELEVCLDGLCTFVGCDSHEECRAYLGIEDEMVSSSKPYVTTAVCRE